MQRLLQMQSNSNFSLFGATHLAILASVPATSWILARAARQRQNQSPDFPRTIAIALGILLGVNELMWYAFKVQKGWFLFPGNLPLQLCDLILWLTVAAMVTRAQFAFEFAFFAGLAGTSMAVLTPDLWEPFPSYPTVYFFLAHCGILICLLYLWWSGLMRPLPGCLWRVMLALNVYAGAVGVFNLIFHTNYMYLCRKPDNASALDYFGPWPVYILVGELFGLTLFALLWLPFRRGVKR